MTPQFLAGNRLSLLRGGAEFFPALLAEIGAAQTDVHLETYIFRQDATGQQVIAALKAAVQRGVQVRVLVDGFGSEPFVRSVKPDLLAAGVQVLVYRQELSFWHLRRYRLRRLHRKVAVIDGRIAFVGGINIVDDYFGAGTLGPRHDYALRVEGPLLRPISHAVAQMWYRVNWARLRRRGPAPFFRLQAQPAGHQQAAWLVRDNLKHRHAIEQAYMTAMASARQEIVIASAYFLPGRRFLQSLLEASARGVRVIILLQGQVEYRLQHYATQALYAKLLSAGVRIFEYQRGFLHAKVAVIDRYWATVGSSNIDPLSLLLAQEGNVVVQDAGFAEQLRADLMRVLELEACELTTSSWRRQSWLARGLRWLSYQLIRMAVAWIYRS